MYSVLFFFKQKTAYEMRISDWSSDVCSSDLALPAVPGAARGRAIPDPAPPDRDRAFDEHRGEACRAHAAHGAGAGRIRQSGRGAGIRAARLDRKSVV